MVFPSLVGHLFSLLQIPITLLVPAAFYNIGVPVEMIRTLIQAMVFLAIPFWFLAILEYVGIWRFWSWVFFLGPRILRGPGVSGPPTFEVGSYLETPSAKFYRTSGAEVLFHCRTKGGFRSSAITTVKGRIRETPQGAIVEVRTLLGFMGFWGCWLLGWLLFTAAFLQNPEHMIENSDLHPLTFGLIGIGAAALFLALLILPERARARRAIRELSQKQAHTTGASDSAQ